MRKSREGEAWRECEASVIDPRKDRLLSAPPAVILGVVKARKRDYAYPLDPTFFSLNHLARARFWDVFQNRLELILLSRGLWQK